MLGALVSGEPVRDEPTSIGHHGEQPACQVGVQGPQRDLGRYHQEVRVEILSEYVHSFIFSACCVIVILKACVNE